jgi:hypothetical protein
MSENLTIGVLHSLGAKGDKRLWINGLRGKWPCWHGVCNLVGNPGQCRPETRGPYPMLLVDIAIGARLAIADAEAAGVAIDDGNVVDLLADRYTNVSLMDIRSALVVAGYSERFPKATSGFHR